MHNIFKCVHTRSLQFTALMRFLIAFLLLLNSLITRSPVASARDLSTFCFIRSTSRSSRPSPRCNCRRRSLSLLGSLCARCPDTVAPNCAALHCLSRLSRLSVSAPRTVPRSRSFALRLNSPSMPAARQPSTSKKEEDNDPNALGPDGKPKRKRQSQSAYHTCSRSYYSRPRLAGPSTGPRFHSAAILAPVVTCSCGCSRSRARAQFARILSPGCFRACLLAAVFTSLLPIKRTRDVS